MYVEFVSMFLAKTVIDDLQPRDKMIKYGTVIQYTCAATTDPEDAKKISWLKDSKPLDLSSPRIKILGNSLLINGTMAKDTGVYACVATNGLDTAKQESKLEIYGKACSNKFFHFHFTSNLIFFLKLIRLPTAN